MADYDCDFCTYKIKCKRSFSEYNCPYLAVSNYSEQERILIYNKVNDILKQIEELKELDFEEYFEDIIDNVEYKLDFEIKGYVDNLCKKEWIELKEKMEKLK